MNRELGPCTVAVAMLSEVPSRFTPEAPATPSGQSTATVLKSSFEQAGSDLLTCMKPPHGTNAGWAEASKCVLCKSPEFWDLCQMERALEAADRN